MNNNDKKELELFTDSYEPNRPNRLCVSLSDIHLTDGSVGLQNLSIEDWESFYAGLSSRCNAKNIEEVTFVLDGDVVDMIRSSKWAENGIYPWQREQVEDFSRIVNEIIHDIVEIKHKQFFKFLRDLEGRLKDDAGVSKVNIVVILGNHDKELLCDQKALSYFYEQGLGLSLNKISDEERASIGRMYGDETLFADKQTAPYFPFYYGDRGFRFFTTHGHWRDETNSRKVYAKSGLPGWTSKDGWQNEVWQQLKFSPFFEPCFGDTVAAGILSTFIYETKKRLKQHGYQNKRLMTILGELDLYRPTYKALTRIIEETKSMRTDKNYDHDAVGIIEDTMYRCIIQWLSWRFTYESSPILRKIIFRIIKVVLKLAKIVNLHMKIILWFVKVMTTTEGSHSDVSLKDMKGFPAFMPAYQHYNFQIHGEGHTHVPLEEEPNVRKGNPTTYINFGTWRDQIIGRKQTGYRRRSVLRVFYILDLKNKEECESEDDRSFKYYTYDLIKWSDRSDSFS